MASPANAAQDHLRVLSEAVHLLSHAFHPWPKDRPLDTKGLPLCPIPEPEAAV